jgi:hypothetical protein
MRMGTSVSGICPHMGTTSAEIHLVVRKFNDLQRARIGTSYAFPSEEMKFDAIEK